MKSSFRILLLAMAMTTFCISTYAQKDNRQRMTREQLAETQAKYIVKEMTMDDVTAKKFTATFCQFQKEIWALGPVLEKSLRAARTQKRSRLLQTGSLTAKRYSTCGRSIMQNTANF